MCYCRVLHVNRLPSSPSERLGSFDFVFGCAWGNLGGGTVQAYSGRYALWNMNVFWEKRVIKVILWHGIATFGYMLGIMFVPQCGKRKRCLVSLSSFNVFDVSLVLIVCVHDRFDNATSTILCAADTT